MASTTRYSDPAANLFKKTNLYFTTNNLLKYQDPTYLGFKLFFQFNQPDSGLLSTIAHPNTAMAYLENIGDKQRAAYLKTFVTLLSRINSECPWFWQAIGGLDSAWKRGYEDDQFKPGLPKDRKIEIVTLEEAVDLRITALIDLYRKACFDWQNRREVVPRNLRYFNVSIYVYEGRTFNKSGDPNSNAQITGLTPNYFQYTSQNEKDYEKLFGKDPLKADSNLLSNGSGNPNDFKADFINDNISRVMFDFSFCEWMPDESGVIVADLSHKEMAMKPQKLVFSYRNVNEANLYRMFGDKQVTDLWVSNLDKLALDNPMAYSKDNPPLWAINGIENPLPGIMNPLWQQILAKKLAFERALDQFKPGYVGRISRPPDGNAYNLLDPLEGLPKAAKDAAIRAINEALRAAAPARAFLMGNVWGFNAVGALAAAAGGLASAAQAGLQEIGKNASKKNNTVDSKDKIGSFGKTISADDNVSLNNRTKDSSDKIGNYMGDSMSLTNADHLAPQAIGTNDYPNSVDIAPNGNYGVNSTSMNNATNDGNSPLGVAGPPANNSTGIPSGNYGQNSTSLNNGADSDPSGNYVGSSTSLNNDDGGAPSGNYGNGSPSINNGTDSDPSGNYGDGSPSIGNANPPAGSIDNVY